MSKESLPILLQDSTIVKEGITLYQVVEKSYYYPNSGRSYRNKRNYYALKSGELSCSLNPTKVLKVQEGFNCRSFVTRDKEGREYSYTVRDAVQSSRFVSTDLLFGTKKAAIFYIKSRTEDDLNEIQDRIDKYSKKLKAFKDCQKSLRVNLRSL